MKRRSWLVLLLGLTFAASACAKKKCEYTPGKPCETSAPEGIVGPE